MSKYLFGAAAAALIGGGALVANEVRADACGDIPGPMSCVPTGEAPVVTNGILYVQVGNSANCQSFLATQTTTVATFEVQNPGGNAPGGWNKEDHEEVLDVGAPVATSNNQGVVLCASVGGAGFVPNP